MSSVCFFNCVFYSHVWAIYELNKAKLNHFDNHLLVELSVCSNLAPVVGEHGKSRLGIAELLQHPNHLETLSGKSFEFIPAPLILAPYPSVSASTLCSAVQLLPTLNISYKYLTLLVHVDDAPNFVSAYHVINRFSILWDIASIPTKTLPFLAETLVDNQCITPERWGGFHFYKNPYYNLPDSTIRINAFQKIINDYSVTPVS